MTFGEQRYGMFAAFRGETSRSLYLARGAPHELARHAVPSLDGDVPDARLIDVVAAKLSVD
jgi:hypothetical protein